MVPVAAPMRPSAERVHEALARQGLLLLSDARFPSIVTLVAGAPVRGSWWAHPAGRAIFRVSEDLADHPDVLVNRLVSGKITYVHRRLWPALLALARARQAWQTHRLSPMARSLLTRVTRAGSVRLDTIAGPPKRLAKAARELEDRLLVHAESTHTERGAHALVLQSWKAWARGRKAASGARAARSSSEDVLRARTLLEQIVDELNSRCGADGRLPWQNPRTRSQSRRDR
jgi:hypothetical protein